MILRLAERRAHIVVATGAPGEAGHLVILTILDS